VDAREFPTEGMSVNRKKQGGIVRATTTTMPTMPRAAAKPTEDAFRALLRAYGLIARVMQPYFTRFGISGSQWAVLRNLHRAELEGIAGLRLRDLSERLLIRPPSVTGVVDRLERQGLVTRGASIGDLRAKQVSLTYDGRQLVERILARHSEQVASVLGALSASEQHQLHGLLDRLGDHLENLAQSSERAAVA
jgi:DNA-binding MarR family transcriptional regulator